MFYRKPPGSFIFGAGRPANPGAGFGPGLNSYDANNLITPLVAMPRPQPMPQPVTLPNSGYPVLDLISGLSQVFTRPKPTMVGPDPTPTFPETQPQGGFGGDFPDYGPPRKRPGDIFDIDPGFNIGPSNDFGWVADRPVEYDEWGKPIKRYPMDERPSPPLRKFPQPLLGQPDVDYAIVREPKPQPGFSLADAFDPAWRDDDGQNKWLDRWGIQPAQDARYLPDYPGMEDNSTGAQISRNWHDAYKQYAFDRIQENAPQFIEHAPQPQPQQSYGDFMGEMQNVASTLLNKGAGLLGSGLGQALNFIPGMGAVMELIGNAANIAGTVAGATGLGGEKAGTALNLLGSVADGAVGGASAGSGEEYGPPMPNADQMQQTPVFDPKFDIKPGEYFPSPEQIWRKMDEAESAGLDPYEALGVPRPAEFNDEIQIPPLQEKRFDQATEGSELNLPNPPYPSWPKDQMPPSPFDPNRPPLPAPKPEPKEYGPEMPKDMDNQNPLQQQTPFDPRKISPTTQAKTLDWSLEAAGALGGPLTSKAIDMIAKPIANEITEKEFQQHLRNIDDMIKVNKDAGNDRNATILENIKKLDQKMRAGNGKSDGIVSVGDRSINELTRSQLINALKNNPAKEKLPGSKKK
ncbi:MAG: hypothetical protein EYC62_01060 [Alphaproteobacteria bacterium]|nr:MAG: hypothetical protein EYC62_01060 [Alphaproteobacteria bacterium]